jgi:hypothetical protein
MTQPSLIPDLPPAPSNAISGRVQFSVALVALALIAIGVAAVFKTNNSTGSGALVAAGVAIGALAMFANRIQTIDAAGVKLQLAQAAVSSLQAAQQADRAGRSDIAEVLRDHAGRLISAAAPSSSR